MWPCNIANFWKTPVVVAATLYTCLSISRHERVVDVVWRPSYIALRDPLYHAYQPGLARSALVEVPLRLSAADSLVC